MIRSTLVWLLFASGFTAGCAATPPGVVSIQARGSSPGAAAGLGELLGQLLNGSSYSSSSSGSSQALTDSGSHHHDTDYRDAVRSYGFRATINTTAVDLVAGMDHHILDDQDVRETSFGIRKRYSEGAESSTAYIQVLARHGEDLKTDRGLRDYDGVSVAIGGLFFIDRHWFIDVSLEFESTWNSVDIDGHHQPLDDWMMGIGVGYSL